MKQSVERLCRIAGKDQRLIIGLMSGTSLDGLDIALCRFTSSGPGCKVEILAFETQSYDDDFRKEIRAIFSKHDVDLEKVCLLNGWVAQQHAEMVMQSLKKWNISPAEVDLLASHGQSIYHAPKSLHGLKKFGNATLQIGDGDHLAVSTGIITLSDFRQKHIAAGGEGAPLAVYGDYFVFSKQGEDRVMLNIGGIANFTWLPGDLDATSVFSTDTGPGNTLMDQYSQRYFNLAYDKNAAIARSGTVNQPLLEVLCDNPFFVKGFPKTTGPELFNMDYLEYAKQKAFVPTISHEDVMTTLNSFSAITIAEAIKRTTTKNQHFTVYTSGGGMHNPLLISHIQALLPQNRFHTTETLGVNPDAKEALLFAVLANECVAGGNTMVGNGNSDIPGISMGKISFPD
jgi:anhydro-N-acetylmuramic acid kinase